MKSVLISIKPKWCELIASGEKTVEVRKTRPKLETPFKVYIYCTRQKVNGEILLTYDKKVEGRNRGFRDEGDIPLAGKVIGEFVCDKIYQYSTTQNCKGVDITDEEMTIASCLTKKEIEDYEFSAEAKDFCIYKIGVYAWHISNLVIYDKPKELSEFYTICPEFDKDEPLCEGCDYEHTEYSGADCPPYFECKCEGRKPIKRPPQSWCYVESEGEG